MAESNQQAEGRSNLVLLLHLFTDGGIVLILKNLLQLWEFLDSLRDRIGYHGMYEILDYDSTLDIQDAKGEKSTITRREVIRFLQDNVVAIHDHAWGDGDIFAEYHCQPGIPVDFYEAGSKHNVLISLRETKNRGDVMRLWVQRVVKGGLCSSNEWLETEIDHVMSRLKLSIIFPQTRPCRRATLTRRHANETIVLDERHFRFLRDGRQELTWQTSRPRLHDCYTIKWDW